MSTVATAVAVLALVGAAVSWIAGAIAYARTLSLIDPAAQPGMRWRAVFAWPFAARQFTGPAAAQAVKVNKAIVAFIACATVAVAAISVATNLGRISR